MTPKINAMGTFEEPEVITIVMVITLNLARLVENGHTATVWTANQ